MKVPTQIDPEHIFLKQLLTDHGLEMEKDLHNSIMIRLSKVNAIRNGLSLWPKLDKVIVTSRKLKRDLRSCR